MRKRESPPSFCPRPGGGRRFFAHLRFTVAFFKIVPGLALPTITLRTLNAYRTPIDTRSLLSRDRPPVSISQLNNIFNTSSPATKKPTSLPPFLSKTIMMFITVFQYSIAAVLLPLLLLLVSLLCSTKAEAVRRLHLRRLNNTRLLQAVSATASASASATATAAGVTPVVVCTGGQDCIDCGCNSCVSSERKAKVHKRENLETNGTVSLARAHRCTPPRARGKTGL